MQNNYLALDVGVVRIGLALANSVARIAAPLPALHNDEAFLANLQDLLQEYSIGTLVVGWPRGLEGQETQQTRYVDDFVHKLKEVITMPIKLQDEALTSVKAEAELSQRRETYSKGEVDSLSAVYILEDFLNEGVN